MFGHNSFDFALNKVFDAPITGINKPKWTNADWGISQAPNWGTDTRSWKYEGYTITQKSKKQEHNEDDRGNDWWKYQTTTTATNADGEKIHEIVGDEREYGVSWGDKVKQGGFHVNVVYEHRNADANAMQMFIDGCTPNCETSTGADPNGCSNENRKVKADETCGDCLTGHSEDDDGKCVEDEEEEVETNWLLYGGMAAVALLAFTM